MCLQTPKLKWYHSGIATCISKFNLAHANEKRDWHIFADFGYMLIAESRKCILPDEDFSTFEDSAIHAVDTTTIDLCLEVFWRAKFRKHKAAIKLPTLLDIKTEIPCYVHITDGTIHEINVLVFLDFEFDRFYVMDLGFVDYERLYAIKKQKAWFVSRAKTNMKCRLIYSAKVKKAAGVLHDQPIMLVNFYAIKNYPHKMRRIQYFDEETNKQFIFLTNNFDLSALQISLLYKSRWKIELFLK